MDALEAHVSAIRRQQERAQHRSHHRSGGAPTSAKSINNVAKSEGDNACTTKVAAAKPAVANLCY